MQEKLARGGTLIVMLALTAAALPGTGASHHGTHFYSYAAGGAADADGCVVGNATTVCAMAGGMLCTNGTLGSDVGGACTGLRVHEGQSFDVSVRDGVADSVAFGVCVDADGDGVCRPDVGGALDLWHKQACGRGPAFLTAPAGGVLYVFVLDEADPGVGVVCVPTTGTITVNIHEPRCSDGLDNDGDGLPDYPLDPECDGPGDNSEQPPACSDGRDNDGDGLVDHGGDPGCDGPWDDDEVDAPAN